MKKYTEAIQEFNRKIIDAMRIPALIIIDDPIKAQSSDFKYGMTDQGDIVSLPSSLNIIWKFLSYPPDNLSKDIWHTINVRKKCNNL
jgi:hypothetical protein